MKLWCIGCFFAVLSISACTYSPVDIYYKDVKKVNLNNPNYSITLEDHKNGDTIYLYNSPDFIYSLSIPNGTLLDVEVSLGNSLIYSSTQPKGTFNLKNSLQSGIFDLTIQYRASTGSGSLADVSGAEQVQIWRKWVLKVDLTPPPSPNMQVSIVNGFLTFTWAKYTKPNFVAYQVSYSREGSYTILPITDPNKNFFVDSSYVGNESVTCQVYTQGYLSGPTSTQIKNTALGMLNVKYDQTDSMATISWMKNPYSSALKQYDLYVDNQLQHSFTNLTDTVYSFKLNAIYGFTNQLELRYVVKYPKSNYSTYQKFDASIANTVADNKFLRPWSSIYFNNGTNSILAVHDIPTGKMIYRFDTNLVLQDSIAADGQLNLVVPYSGTTVYYTKAVQGYFYYTDLLTKQVSSKSLTNYGNGPGFCSASGNGLVCYYYYYPASPGYTQVEDIIFNTSTSTYITPSAPVVLTNSFHGDGMTISDDGKSFTINGTFYNLNGTKFTKLGAFLSGTVIGYRPDNPAEVMLATSTGLEIYKTSNLILKRTVQPPAGYSFYAYDPITRQALFSGTSSVYLIDIDTQKMREAYVYNTKVAGASFVGGYLITRDGHYIKL